MTINYTNTMKKFFSLIAALALVSYSAVAATVSAGVAAGGVSNIISGSFIATQFVLTSTNNNIATIRLLDAPTAVVTNVTPSYVTTGAYATNYITSYTNYFGVQNNFTNVALVHYSITNAATTNFYPTILALNAGTNETVVIAGVNYQFIRGLTITNAGASPMTLSVTYVQ